MTSPAPEAEISWGSSKLRMGDQIGKGSFGVVYKAEVVGSNPKQEFAVKVLDRSRVKTARQEEEIKSEVQNQRRLSRHPHIVHLEYFKATATHYYIVMQLCESGSVYGLMKRRHEKYGNHRFDENTSRRIFQHLVSAIFYAHKKSIAHRDIKAGNLLIDKKGSVLLCDFGLSKMRESCEEVECKTYCGTICYMSPEILKRQNLKRTQGESYSGLAADCWAAGVMLFELLSGRRPYPLNSGESDAIMADQIVSDKVSYKMSHCIPDGAIPLVKGLLEKDPAKRLTVDDIIKDKWFSVGFNSEKELYSYFPSASSPSPPSAASATAASGSASSKAAQQQEQEQKKKKEAAEAAAKAKQGEQDRKGTPASRPPSGHGFASPTPGIGPNDPLHYDHTPAQRLAVSPAAAAQHRLSPVPGGGSGEKKNNSNNSSSNDLEKKKKTTSPAAAVPSYMKSIHHHQPHYRPHPDAKQ